jgi:hypothetical protein
MVANSGNTVDITARAARSLGEGNIYDPPNLVEVRRIGISGAVQNFKDAVCGGNGLLGLTI